MAKFTFRLATFLRLREAARDERRGELAEAFRVDDVLRARLAGLTDELRRLQEHSRQIAQPGKLDLDWLVEGQRYELTLKSQQSQLGQQRESVAAEIERRRLALVEANRDVRVMEKLREKQVERYQFEENRQALKQLDELAQRRAGSEVGP
jgi:flagellar FliJ protein